MDRKETGFGLWILSVLLLIFVAKEQFGIWFSDDGMLYLRKLEHAHRVQEQKNHILSDANEKLLNHIHHLKHSPELMEGVMRKRLHVIGKKEVFVAYPK